MTGPHDSIIGMERAEILQRFVTGLPARMEPASGNPRLQAIVIDADERTGLARGIERLDWPQHELAGALRKGDDDESL
jgi:2',3'-cyclic-nucleotide 2'-phosphodiesterase